VLCGEPALEEAAYGPVIRTYNRMNEYRIRSPNVCLNHLRLFECLLITEITYVVLL
jgi:hypothetical protein